MANVPNNICIPWPSTAASIPAGFSRETSLDSKFVRGAATGADSDLAGSFGQATHGHNETAGGHAPTANAHSHSVSSGSNTGTVNYNTGGGNNLIGTHSHSSSTSGSEVVTLNTSTITIATASNDPPYRKVIWIKSDGTPTGFPSGSYIFFDSDTFPTSWTRQEGNNFLLGAAAAADGSGSGGAVTHQHNESGTHVHVQNSHGSGHDTDSSAASATIIGGNTSTAAADLHVHPLTFSSVTATCNASSVTIGTTDGQPPWYKLNTIRNDTGGTDYPTSAIVIYLGSNASIPANYARYTAMDGNFLKSCNANFEVGTSGGSSQHNHSGTCATSGPTHNHTVTGGGADLVVGKGNNATASVSSTGHTHVWTSIATTITFQDKALSIDNNTSETNYPPYQKVIFVKYTAPAAATTSLLPLMGVG